MAALAILAGCSPETHVVTGVGVDARGGLIGYIQMCGHHVDGATFYDTGGFNGKTKGSWASTAPVTDFARWSLESPTDGWTTSGSYVPPSGDHEYSLYGWTTDNSASAEHVTFHLSDVSGLAPGEVLYTQAGKLVRRTEEEFQNNACAQ